MNKIALMLISITFITITRPVIHEYKRLDRPPIFPTEANIQENKAKYDELAKLDYYISLHDCLKFEKTIKSLNCKTLPSYAGGPKPFERFAYPYYLKQYCPNCKNIDELIAAVRIRHNELN